MTACVHVCAWVNAGHDAWRWARAACQRSYWAWRFIQISASVFKSFARPARAFRVIDNRTSELTSWDTDLLPDALAGLDDLDIFSFDNVLPLAVTAGKTDPDDIPETPKKPITRTGDLWVLRKHRIVCGDSTNQETVERLLDGAKPDLW